MSQNVSYVHIKVLGRLGCYIINSVRRIISRVKVTASVNKVFAVILYEAGYLTFALCKLFWDVASLETHMYFDGAAKGKLKIDSSFRIACAPNFAELLIRF